MVGIPFKMRSQLLLKLFPHLKDQEIIYGAGQPMGAYSSWAVFALTHHFVVRSCGLDVGHDGYDKYFLLGDDILLWDNLTAGRYKYVKSEILDVQINMTKSYQSRRVFEFAKRLFIDSVEVSPFTWTQLLRVENTLDVLAGYIADVAERSSDNRVITYKFIMDYLKIVHSKWQPYTSYDSIILEVYLRLINMG
jgi:hypothetical protein